MHICLFIILYCVNRTAGFLSQVRAPSQIGEDPDLKISDATSSITESMIAADIEPEKEEIKPPNKAETIIEELSEIRPVSRIDPPMEEIESLTQVAHESTIDNCQRDYSTPCPVGFVYQQLSDGTHKCLTPKFYAGPCRGEDLVYREMTADEKALWSRNCMANWPCMTCTRNYSAFCPDNWELSGGNFECKSLNSYSGPCKGETFSFIDYNIAMQKDWSRMCKAYWPCATS